MRFYENKVLILSLVIIVGASIWYGTTRKSTPSSAVAAVGSSLEVGPSFSKGDANAPVKLVQYSDFLCPSCSQVSLGVVPKIVQEYVDTGKVYFQFRPLAFIAPGSLTAATGAYCAADQQKFWEYHDAAYQAVWVNYFSKGVDPQNVPLYSQAGVMSIAAQAGVSKTQFDDCLTGGSKVQLVKSYTAQAQKAGVVSTPHFEVNGQVIKGVPTYDILAASLKAAGVK